MRMHDWVDCGVGLFLLFMPCIVFFKCFQVLKQMTIQGIVNTKGIAYPIRAIGYLSQKNLL